jgi:hypothetical protein
VTESVSALLHIKPYIDVNQFLCPQNFCFCLFYRQSEGLSGRTLRKIPFLAHAYYVQVPQVSLEDFIKAMHDAVVKQLSDSKDFSYDAFKV